MAIAQTSKLSVNLTALLSDSLDLSTVRDEVIKPYTIDIGNGTGAGLANQMFSDTRTVTTGATDTLDFAGVLLNGIRQTITLTALKLLIIRPAAANTTILSVTRPAANGVPIFAAAGDACPVGPGGIFVWSAPGAGVAVTAGTGDLVDIVNAAGASATYDVIAIGVQ
jgi:hypothetical protein